MAIATLELAKSPSLKSLNVFDTDLVKPSSDLSKKESNSEQNININKVNLGSDMRNWIRSEILLQKNR